MILTANFQTQEGIDELLAELSKNPLRPMPTRCDDRLPPQVVEFDTVAGTLRGGVTVMFRFEMFLEQLKEKA